MYCANKMAQGKGFQARRQGGFACGTCPLSLHWLPKVGESTVHKYAVKWPINGFKVYNHI